MVFYWSSKLAWDGAGKDVWARLGWESWASEREEFSVINLELCVFPLDLKLQIKLNL